MGDNVYIKKFEELKEIRTSKYTKMIDGSTFSFHGPPLRKTLIINQSINQSSQAKPCPSFGAGKSSPLARPFLGREWATTAFWVPRTFPSHDFAFRNALQPHHDNP
jgi:hypothetical protein